MTARYGNNGLAQGYAALVGVVLVVVGLLGFINNPIVGPNGLFVTDTVHNIVHLATGALALFIAFGLRGEQQANGVIGFGVLYLIVFVALLLSPTLFGLLQRPVNMADHVLHAALGVVSIAVGYLAKQGAGRTATTR